MKESEKWLDNFYAEQHRRKIQEERNKIAEEKIHSDAMNAQADRDLRYQLSIQQEEERTKRERLKIEQAQQNLQHNALVDVQKTEITARNNLEMADKTFQQTFELKKQEFEASLWSKHADLLGAKDLKAIDNQHDLQRQQKEQEQARFLQAREIESKHTMQANQLSYELKKQEYDHKQACYVQASTYAHEIALKEQERATYAYKNEVDTQHYIARSLQDLEAYEQRAVIDVKAHLAKTTIETEAYKQRAKADEEKRINDAFCYHYERAVDAKWKVWVMEQELRIFGRKATDEEIRDYVQQNRERWDKEL